MDALNTIVLIGGVAGAVSAVIALVVIIAKAGKAVISFIKGLETNVKTLIEHDNAQYLSILRLTITADHMPMSERLSAGKKYVEAGGNGDVKKLYETLKKECNSIHIHDEQG